MASVCQRTDASGGRLGALLLTARNHLLTSRGKSPMRERGKWEIVIKAVANHWRTAYYRRKTIQLKQREKHAGKCDPCELVAASENLSVPVSGRAAPSIKRAPEWIVTDTVVIGISDSSRDAPGLFLRLGADVILGGSGVRISSFSPWPGSTGLFRLRTLIRGLILVQRADI